jgi:hypothetical protein
LNPPKRNPGNMPSSVAGKGTWKRFRRAIYCRLMHDDRRQLYLPGCRPGHNHRHKYRPRPGHRLDAQKSRRHRLFDGQWAYCLVITNAAVTNWPTEPSRILAMSSFPSNSLLPMLAWYYMMLVGHFLLESFKEDVSAPVIAGRFLCQHGTPTLD